MKAPKWVPLTAVVVIHDRQIARHGGGAGLRDRALLEMGCARPMNLFAYGNPSIEDLAAAYAFGLVRAHAFVDGNKADGARDGAHLPSAERLWLSSGDAGRPADGRGACLG
jgi:prophage maintenance system killer protein